MKNEERRTAQNIPATDQQNHLQEALSTLESLFDDHFECAICLETFSSPNVIPDCLHRFCNACIKGSIQRCGNECPTCKAKITISKRCVKKDQLLEDVIEKVQSAIKSLKNVTMHQMVGSVIDLIQEGKEQSIGSRSLLIKDKIDMNTSPDAKFGLETEGSPENDMKQRQASCTEMVPKIKTDHDEVFDTRCRELVAFKEEFGHCNVPRRYSINSSLAKWCGETRTVYNMIQEGKPTAGRDISQEHINRLEGIGFKWKVVDHDKTFKSHCKNLVAFKEEFGHCNVPHRYPDNQSLARWCSNMRTANEDLQKGKKVGHNFSKEKLELLQKIGFQWNVHDEVFDTRCRELVAFKEEFGHCNVPRRYSINSSLAKWCGETRTVYNMIQEGKPTAGRDISQEHINHLEGIGFKWKVVDHDKTFKSHCKNLVAFKEEFGHCNVPHRYPDNQSLARWCSNMRTANDNLQKGKKAGHYFSKEKLELLQKIGFQWAHSRCSVESS